MTSWHLFVTYLCGEVLAVDGVLGAVWFVMAEADDDVTEFVAILEGPTSHAGEMFGLGVVDFDANVVTNIHEDSTHLNS